MCVKNILLNSSHHCQSVRMLRVLKDCSYNWSGWSICVTLLWIDSSLSIWVFVSELCHTGHAYSRIDWIMARYILRISWFDTRACFNSVNRYRRWKHLEWKYSTWGPQLRPSDRITLSTLKVLVCSTGVPSRTTAGGSLWFTEKSIFIVLVLSALVFMRFLDDQVSACLAASRRWLSWQPEVQISHTLLSSTYLRVRQHVCRLLICRRKHTGPHRVPCGTPAMMVLQLGDILSNPHMLLPLA